MDFGVLLHRFYMRGEECISIIKHMNRKTAHYIKDLKIDNDFVAVI